MKHLYLENTEVGVCLLQIIIQAKNRYMYRYNLEAALLGMSCTWIGLLDCDLFCGECACVDLELS